MKHFEEILLTLGAARCEALLETKNWTLWGAEFRTPFSTVKGSYLYLKSSCPLSEATPANLSTLGALSGSQGYQLIVPPKSDLARDLASTVAKFRAKDGKTTQTLLQEHLLRGVSYKHLQREEYFIEPSVVVNDKTVQDGLAFLTRWLVGESGSTENAPIGLLSADGGIGKTTLARELCEAVRAKYPKVMPLLIESDQWKNIANTGFTLDSLWDIAVTRRLENGNLLRSNPAALRVLMQEGLLVVIFDGFDELAAMSADQNRPQEIISELKALFTPEDEAVSARIILTSRATYWKAISQELEGLDSIEVFRLTGFDNNQRKNYFEKRLSNTVQRDLALRLARQVSGAIYAVGPDKGATEGLNEDRFSGTPFILSLIAHYLESGEADALSPYEPDPLEPLIVGVCRRENIRQDLHISPDTQISLFEEIFRSNNGEIEVADLDLLLQIYDVDDPNVRQRFQNHFLLQRIGITTLAARFEVLRIYFIARFLAKSLQRLYTSSYEKDVALTLAKNSIGQSQVSEWLAWQLKRLSPERLAASIRHAFELINLPENLGSRHRASIALSHLIAQLVKGDEKLERARDLFALIGGEETVNSFRIRGSTFAGRMRGYDFSNTSFVKCTFVDVEFSNCKFSESTLMELCAFEGALTFSSCEDTSAIVLNGGIFSPDAELTISRIKSRLPSIEVRNAFAEEVLTKVLKKFKGDSGFRSIQARHKQSGMNPRNPFNAEVWDSLKRQGIISDHEISGVSEGGCHITDEREIRREVSQYLDNGIIGNRLRAVLTSLVS